MIFNKLSRTMRMVNDQQLPATMNGSRDHCEVLGTIRFVCSSKEFMSKNHDIGNRKKSDARSSVSSHVNNTPGWKGCAILGCLLFMILYWMIPEWLNHELSALRNSSIRPIAATLLMRRIYWIRSAGIALGSVCIFFAVRNYCSARSFRKSICKSGGININYFNRLLAKLID